MVQIGDKYLVKSDTWQHPFNLINHRIVTIRYIEKPSDLEITYVPFPYYIEEHRDIVLAEYELAKKVDV